MVTNSHNPRIRLVAKLLHRGSVIAYPTESVWGLGCDPFNYSAVARLLRLKNRSFTKGLILIASRIEQLAPFLEGLNREQYQTLEQSWPGPHTWLVPNNHVAPDWITGGKTTLAVRVSSHLDAAALCKAFGGPVVSTSANPQGLPPAKTALKVRCYFKNRIDAILPGRVGQYASPTSIRNVVTDEIVRPG